MVRRHKWEMLLVQCTFSVTISGNVRSAIKSVNTSLGYLKHKSIPLFLTTDIPKGITSMTKFKKETFV